MATKINRIIILIIITALLGINYTNFQYKSFIPGIALVLGIILTGIQKDISITHHTKVWSTKVLSYAIILLGFGFNLNNILKAGISGMGYTVISIAGTLILGLLMGKLLKNQGKISTLISSGTAICGGSAIAAISPIIRASHEETAVAMGAVFLLNAVGLLVFPIIGHQLNLSQHQFGLLAALAIHDTSSVVGSCMSYGQESLIVGTTVKLVRALWIIPVSLIITLIYAKINHNKLDQGKTKKPWFILWFILASLLVTAFPSLKSIGGHLKELGESFFMVALFLIGYNVSFANLKAVGAKVILQAVTLWMIVSILVILALRSNILN
ncbi:MAG: putative sulfate exporter family transporter [Burkholderiales bacterium]|nr:putative sulfate exporter family transporter [Burkholderiales bacterium]